MPAVKIYVRPDGRRFVRDPDVASLAETKGDVYCTVDASEIDSYLALGFNVHRREGTYVVPTLSARVAAPAGIVFVSADEVGDVSLRLLDDELRQDVPARTVGSGVKPPFVKRRTRRRSSTRRRISSR